MVNKLLGFAIAGFALMPLSSNVNVCGMKNAARAWI